MVIRQTALKCVISILEYSKNFQEIINIASEQVKNPSELINLVAGTIKYTLNLDYFLQKISSKNIKRLSPEIRNVLRLALYEIKYTKNPHYAVINSYVEIVNKNDSKAGGFVNAILRNYLRKEKMISLETENNLSVKYSHPQWMIEGWIKNFGQEEAEKICEFNNNPPKISLRVNNLKINNLELVEIFDKNDINYEKSRFFPNCFILKNPGNLKKIPGYSEGFWNIQGESSFLAVEMLNPQQGEEILDFCAAPGTKTMHIADKIGNKGKITAVDINSKRTERIFENCQRLGVENIDIIIGNAAELRLNKMFDKILADVPCSNTGVLAKRPDARFKKTSAEILQLAELQLKILNNAVPMLKNGGVLVYSTCSIEPEENSLLIKKFLTENPNMNFASAKLNLKFLPDNPAEIQILQSKHNMDGFYIARLQKNYTN